LSQILQQVRLPPKSTSPDGTSERMSYSHTPVTASVNKSTSRFAPKAVPRKPPTALPVKSTATVTIDEGSGSEDDGDADVESRGDWLEDSIEKAKGVSFTLDISNSSSGSRDGSYSHNSTFNIHINRPAKSD
jgi:hypothetical protein